MKTKKFFENSVLGLATFLFTSAVVMSFWTILTFDKDSDKSNGQSTPVISRQISVLQQERNMLYGKLEKAKADRNKDHAMVAGLYFQPSQDLAEISNIEGKISKLDHKIAALEKNEKHNADGHDNDFQQLALK